MIVPGASRAPRHAALASGAILLATYLATLAPTVTPWDSGEFLSAIRTLGIPHPPGTPLFILVARVWADLVPGVPFALAANAGSAVATAGACGALALLVTRWTGRWLAGVAGAVAGGTMATVWQNATETEVYAWALLLVVLLLVVADRAGERWSARHRALLAFLFGLAVPLHLSVLVAGPAVLLLAGTDAGGDWSVRAALRPAGAWCIALGVGTVTLTPLVAGVILVALGEAVASDGERGDGGVATILLVLLGASLVVVMLVRARHDPAVNQGNPATWSALMDVVARRQYDVPPLWPRRAPFWLQMGNLLQYADWQVAWGVSNAVGASLQRTPLTVAFAALGLCGSLWHRRRDRRSWRTLALLLASATLGVVVVLNLRAGPSFGWGILPDDALREARERDYFFALAFLLWGVWAGCGVAAIAERIGRAPGRALLAIACLPLALNWQGVDRRRPADAQLTETVGLALLRSVPLRGILVLAGDTDSYSVWFAQHVLAERPDVVPVTVPLLGATWYREELRRRHALLPDSLVVRWGGMERTLAALAVAAETQGRPVSAAVTLPAADRRRLGARWRLEGMTYAASDSLAPVLSIDSARSSEGALAVRRIIGDESPHPSREPLLRYLRALLRCPETALRQSGSGGSPAGARLLETTCNYR